MTTTAAARPATAADVQCTMERPTGTNLEKKVCTTKAQREAIRVATQEARAAMQRSPSSACPSSSGCAK